MISPLLLSRLLQVQMAFCSELADELTIVLSAADNPDVSAAVQRIIWRLEAFRNLAKSAGGSMPQASFEFLTK